MQKPRIPPHPTTKQEILFLRRMGFPAQKKMKRNWELIDFVVKTIAESDKDIFGVNDFKSAETSEKEIKYTLKLMLDRGLVFDETTRYGVVQVGQLTWEGQNYYESEVSPDRQCVQKRPHR